MRLPLRITLLTAFLILALVLVVGHTLLLNRGFRRDLLSIQERELAREMELAPAFLESLGFESLDSLALALARRIGYPVTFLNEAGVVLAASSDLGFQRRGMTIPPGSPEFVEALEGDVGFDRRRGPDEVEIRLFAARRVEWDDGDLILQVAVPMDEIDRTVRGRVWSSLGWSIPAVFLALIFTLVVGHMVARPLQTVRRRARSLASENFSRRIPRPFRVKELDDLAESFNRLSEELQNRFQYLEGERDEMQNLIDCMGEAVIALTEDVKVLRTNRAAIGLLGFPDPVPFAPIGALVRQPSLRSLLESSVRQPFAAREVTLGERSLIVSARAVDGGGAVITFLDVSEIRRLEMVRRDFVANASHELKTPLTAMRGFAETLLEDDPPEDLRRVFLSSIRSNTLRLQNLVDDLLDLSRLESGGWVARKEEVDVGPLAREIWEDLRPRADEKGLDFTLEGEGEVWADERGVGQVLRNLLDNAIRYTPEGGSVAVEVRQGGAEIRIEVRDTGIGIPTPALTRIFERFYRVDPARSRAEGGTGLGLAIVRHLVEAMDGEVWAESELGQGTSIFVSLPAIHPPQPIPSSED
jgi:signal transduction histidine kinase/HAMP domain-containing protein